MGRWIGFVWVWGAGLACGGDLTADLSSGTGGADAVTADTSNSSSANANVSTGTGSGGANSSGGAGGDACMEIGTAFDEIHGCVPADAEDQICQDEVVVSYGFDAGVFYYAPRCVVVSAGATVTFTAADQSDFNIHPLQGGIKEPKKLIPDPESPISFTNGTGKSASFVMPDAGTFPYYCVAHASVDMVGVIYVDGESR